MLFWVLMNVGEALSCDYTPMHAPSGRLTNVPLNFRPFVASSDPRNFWALRKKDQHLDEAVGWLDLGGDAFYMIPTEDLQPKSEYRLVSVEQSDEVFAYIWTGDTRDEQAPSATVDSVERFRSKTKWGNTHMLTFNLLDASPDIQVVLVEMSEDDGFGAPYQVWQKVYHSSTGVSFGIGEGLCQTSVPSDMLDSHRYVRLTFYDWAGNGSDTVMIDTVYEQSLRKKWGCSNGQGVPLLAFIFGLFGLRRRRKQ